MQLRALVLVGVLGALAGSPACSSSTDNRVEIVDGSVTTTTTSPGTAVDGTGTIPDLGSPTLTDASQVTTAGVGDVRFGMTVDEAQRAAGTELDRQEGGSDDCFVVVPREGPAGLSFLVADGRVERLDVTEPGLATPSGAKVGTSESELRELYPDRLEERATDAGRALVFVPADPGDAEFRIVFETDGNTVTAYRSGRLPQVDLAGC